MNTMTIRALSMLLMITGSAAFAQDAEKPSDDSSEARVCINTNNVRTFDGLTDLYLYVGEGANKHYLLTLKNPCPGLRFSQAIGLKNTTSRICSGGFGEVVFRDGPGNSFTNSCRIDKIERLENRDQAKERVAEYAKAASDANKGIDEAEKDPE